MTVSTYMGLTLLFQVASFGMLILIWLGIASLDRKTPEPK